MMSGIDVGSVLQILFCKIVLGFGRIDFVTDSKMNYVCEIKII